MPAPSRIEPADRDLAAVVERTERILEPFVRSLDVRALAAHNAGYLAYEADPFFHFVTMEKARFISHLRRVTERPGELRVCDLGTFVPYLPVALSLLGHQVTIVEALSMYDASFADALHELASRCGITLLDRNILADSFADLPPQDVVLLTAVVEHLPGSPRALVQKSAGMLRPDGRLIFEVPNIAEFTKRLMLLLGRSPLPHYPVYLDSAFPFTGHHREMTVDEVRYLLENSGLRVEMLGTYDYAPPSRTYRGTLLRILKKLAPLSHKHAAIQAVARPAQA